MPIETELKLRIAPEQLAGLKKLPLFKALSIARPVTHRLHNIYFDTPELALHKSEMALRLRRSGRQWLQTLKGGGSVKAGLHQRNEWEMPVSGPALDFSLPETAEWEELLPPSLRKELRPVFTTDFSRSSRILSWQDAQIELCVDQGEVRTEQRSTPICELELELKSGEPRQLFELALAILETVPFELEVVSKAERGYRLLYGDADKPAKGDAPGIAKKDTLADVLQTLIWSCLLHLQSNLHGAMGSDENQDIPEYLHQMRVALRRLRVVLRMAAKFRADSQLAALSKEVAALCIALGRIREWDVFIAEVAQPMRARMADHAGLQALLAASEQQRADCYTALRSEAQARELQRLILRFAIWMNGPYWQQPAEAVPQARDFAALQLHSLAKRFARTSHRLSSLKAQKLHGLRIISKKLRYSAEFFAPLFDKRKARAFLSALSKIQEVLGQINDITVAHRLLGDLTSMPELSAHRKMAVLARSWIGHSRPRHLAALRKAIRRFNKQPAFWEE